MSLMIESKRKPVQIKGRFDFYKGETIIGLWEIRARGWVSVFNPIQEVTGEHGVMTIYTVYNEPRFHE